MTASPPPVANVGLREAKRSVRERILRARDALPAQLRTAASAAIAATLSGRSDFTAAGVVLLTLPFGSEWDTRLLLSAALAQGKTVALPDSVRRAAGAARCTAPPARSRRVIAAFPNRAECPPVALASIDWVLMPVASTLGRASAYRAAGSLLPLHAVEEPPRVMAHSLKSSVPSQRRQTRGRCHRDRAAYIGTAAAGNSVSRAASGKAGWLRITRNGLLTPARRPVPGNACLEASFGAW
jgi:hypothetical protein